LPAWGRRTPDRLIYASDVSGKWEIYAWDRRRQRHRQVTDRPQGTLKAKLDPQGGAIWWFRDSDGDECGRWIAEPFRRGPALDPAPELPPAFQAGLALGQDFAVIGCATAEGTRAYLVGPDRKPHCLYAHAEWAEVEELSADERLLCLSHAEHGDVRHPALRVYDLEGNPLAELSDGLDSALWLNGWAGGWSPIPGDSRLLVQHERMGPTRPLLWHLASGNTEEIDLALPGEVEAVWYPDGRSLLLLHDYQGSSELYRLDIGSRAVERLPLQAGTILEARIHPGGQLWYAWTRSSTPLQIRAGKRVLLRPPGEPAPSGVGYSRHLVGRIPVFLARPSTSAPHPVVVLLHGGPQMHERDAFSPVVQAWIDHGFAVALVNYRGSTGYGREWCEAARGNPGLAELEDAAAVAEWLLRTHVAQPDRLVLAGASWGGYLTLLGLGLQPERWAAGIALAPIADYETAYADEPEPVKAFDRALFGGAPAEIPDFYRLRSPITYADRLRVPVLLIAGTNDPRCPLRQIERYAARLRDLGKEHEIYRYEMGHGTLITQEMIRQMEVQLDFAARRLGLPIPKAN
jgi:dienelactone hydrolase